LIRQCQDFADAYASDAVTTETKVVAEARYENQVWEIDVPVGDIDFSSDDGIAAFRRTFDERHAALFSISDPNSHVEIVALRANVRARVRPDQAFRIAEPTGSQASKTRPVYFIGMTFVETPVYALDSIPEDEMFSGPAILESPFTTIVLDPDSKYVRRPSGSVVIYP
jgi:N-methylhydantoinase A